MRESFHMRNKYYYFYSRFLREETRRFVKKDSWHERVSDFLFIPSLRLFGFLLLFSFFLVCFLSTSKMYNVFSFWDWVGIVFVYFLILVFPLSYSCRQSFFILFFLFTVFLFESLLLLVSLVIDSGVL